MNTTLNLNDYKADDANSRTFAKSIGDGWSDHTITVAEISSRKNDSGYPMNGDVLARMPLHRYGINPHKRY